MTYEGDFVKSKMEGVGTCTFVDGRKFVGQWQQGHITGQGRMSWPNGSEYCGDYVRDSKHGNGTFTWPDGRSYRGEWRDGAGVATDAHGNVIHGQWSRGRLAARSQAGSR